MSKPTVPAETRALAVIVLLDALLGLWLANHRPEALAGFAATQLPIVGIGAVLWGLLPDDSKDRTGATLVRVLAWPVLTIALVVIAVAGIAASVFFAGVVVRSVDPDATTDITVVPGSHGSPDSSRLAMAKPERLNRLTTPLRWLLVTPPWGKQVWLYTPTHVLSVDRRIIPWKPVTLDYPDDFQEMVTIAILPSLYSKTKLEHNDVYFRLFDESLTPRERVAEQLLGDYGSYVSFIKHTDISETIRDRWRKMLAVRHSAGSGLDTTALRVWEATDKPRRWIPAAKPLTMGQRFKWEIAQGGKVLKTGWLTLDARMSEIHLEF